jgi:hypothetical protein
MMIEIGKTYQTRDGREARVYATDGGGEYPVQGAYRDHGKIWLTATWTLVGELNDGGPHPLDLIEVKPKITREYWIQHFMGGHAAIHPRMVPPPCSNTVAITGPHEITFTEGDGL